MSFRLDINDGHFARTLEVKEPLLTVGTGRRCGIRLDSEGVARQHAKLRMCGKSVVIEDLGAPAGILIAGKRVHRAALRAGDEVRLGRARLRILDVLPVPRSAAHAAMNGDERRRRRAAGAFGGSLLAHAALLVLLWTWTLREASEPERPVVYAVASLDRPPAMEDFPVETPPPDTEQIAPRPPDEAEVLPIEEELPPPDLSWLKPPPPPEPVAPIQRIEETPAPEEVATLGVGGSELPPEVVSRGFGKDDADVGNRIAAGLMEESAGAVLKSVRGGATPSKVWVIRGDYDQAEKTLTELSIDHNVLAKDALETRAIPSTVRVLIYNCTGRPMSREAQARIAAWVKEGGWLVSTDWGVERLLEHGFPGTLVPLRAGERPILTKDETVMVRATTNKGLGEGVQQDGKAWWWLEDSSVPFTIAEGLEAQVLVRSDELERRHGPCAAGVAVSFAHGKGRVLHLLGHLYQQEGNVRGALLVHRLLVNTLDAALR